jgi:5-exo-hydroxycamphor dehydrogenase
MVFVGPRRPLERRVETVDDPGPGAVLLRTHIAGVCGTDAHRLDGDLPDPGRPVTFGHEGRNGDDFFVAVAEGNVMLTRG